MVRITLHGGPRDGWVYEVDEPPEVVRASAFDPADPRRPLDQAPDPDREEHKR